MDHKIMINSFKQTIICVIIMTYLKCTYHINSFGKILYKCKTNYLEKKELLIIQYIFVVKLN